MATHGRRDQTTDQSTIRILQVQMERMTVDFEKVCRENTEMKAQLQWSAGESSRRRDSDALIIEKERNGKLCDQLKLEKSHLIETILELSNENDAVFAENSIDQQHLQQRIRNFIDMDKQTSASRSKMEEEIVDAVIAGGMRDDSPLIKKIEEIIRISKNKLALAQSQGDFIPSPYKGNNGNNNGNNRGQNGQKGRSEFDDIRPSEHLDAASLKTMEVQLSSADAFELGGHSGHGGNMGQISNDTGDPRSRRSRGAGSIRSNKSRRKLSLCPGKKRGKQAMERDETESVISSVSTHRSVKSLGSLSMSWFRNPNGEKIIEKNVEPKNKGGGAITAENLAILNGLNDGGGQNGHSKQRERNEDRVGRQQKTPGDGDRGKESFWWPTLF